jgi:hypothetical protein
MSNAVVTTGILVRRGTGVAGTSKTITSSSVDPLATTITTSAPHGLVTGQQVTIATHTGSTPSINGTWRVKVTGPSTYTIPIAVTVGGTGGTSIAAEVFDTIAEIVTATPPGWSRAKLEASNHNEGVQSKVLGMLEQKDPTFRVNYIGSEATHQSITADIFGNVKRTWMFSFPSGISVDGPARVSNFEFADAPMNAIQQADVELVWAAAATLTA